MLRRMETTRHDSEQAPAAEGERQEVARSGSGAGLGGRPRVFSIAPDADFLARLAAAMRHGLLPGGGGVATATHSTGATGEAQATDETAFPAFAGWRIYLPTRRAARALAAAMLGLAGGTARAQLLPRILPLGDVDEDELLLDSGADFPSDAWIDAWDGNGGANGDSGLPQLPPPAIAPLPRLFLLAELMREWAGADADGGERLARHLRSHPGSVWRLARSLARLLDSFDNEEVPLDAVARLWAEQPIQPERPEHLRAAQRFLAFLARHWPALLRKRGLISAAARRSALIRMEAAWLRARPPRRPVIAAGSTGSLPATAELLSVIARLPQGCVVLPGLDAGMDEDSWNALQPGHPQYGLRELLRRMGVERSEVVELPPLERHAAAASGGAGKRAAPGQAVADMGAAVQSAERPDTGQGRVSPRVLLLREAMRPVETTERWREAVRQHRDALRDGADGMFLLQAPTRRQEALAIALLMRDTLRQPRRTCMLVTPDRTLARAVRAELARWNVWVDDSAGRPLIDTTGGTFLKLLMQVALEDFRPQALVALLAHPLACFGMAREECARAAADLEMAVLRSLQRFDGLAALPDIAERRARLRREGEGVHEHPNVRHMSDARWQQVVRLAKSITDALLPLREAFGDARARAGRRPAADLLHRLLRVAERIATPPGQPCLLWQHEEGEALAAALAEILREAGRGDGVCATPCMRPQDLATFLRTELSARAVRPHQPTHARLSILGLLEARLLRADRVILGGLNEGTWPEIAQNDPWLNRTDRAHLALPLPERRMGLSAHDFVQLAAAGEVWLTCAERVEQQPMEPSRWLVRLQAVLRAAGHDQLLHRRRWPLERAARLDDPRCAPAAERLPDGPVSPPRPAPPRHLRPRRISASRVRTLLRDPYAIFARQVLRLEPMPRLAAEPTPAVFGSMVHAAFEDFARRWPRALPDDPQAELLALLEEKHGEYIGDAAHLAQVRGRLARIAAAWIGICEARWRQDPAWLRAHAELSGRAGFSIEGESFELSARADRIDVLADGGVRIIDYKTGMLPNRHPASSAYDPQLDLEAALAMRGGFTDLGDARRVDELVLVRLSGADDDPLEVQEWHRAGSRQQKDRRTARQRADDAWHGLQRLLAAYMNEDQPYLPLDDGQREQRPGDYDHFSRWREWLSLLAG